jgi:hypothetical protein
MENQPKFPTCLTNFTANENRALDKMLDRGRQLSAQQEKDIRKSWKNWREKRDDARVRT